MAATGPPTHGLQCHPLSSLCPHLPGRAPRDPDTCLMWGAHCWDPVCMDGRCSVNFLGGRAWRQG